MERIWAGHIYVVRVVTKFIQGKGKTLPKAVWSLPGWMERKKDRENTNTRNVMKTCHTKGRSLTEERG
jgi:hypothetical protein